ncbi:MAG: hypothetical protein GXP31_04240 [Kiritimatiellaeota bacterium]|nr:hypothetical protein [Kiritimatiellota bacterium]
MATRLPALWVRRPRSRARPACRFAGLLLVLSAGLSGNLFSADARPDATNRWGVCVHPGALDFEQQLDLVRDAGIGWIRCDFFWDSIQPQKDVFTFRRYDPVVEQARRRGLRVLPILDYNSRWAGRAHEHLDLWERFVETTVRRYAGRIRVWEVWNEENGGFWNPHPDPAQYARLLARTYRTIKRVDPGLQVLYGGLIGTDVRFVRQSLGAGAAGCFDALAFHPYCQPRSPRSSGRLEEFLNLRAMLGERKAPQRFWITEIGWPSTRLHSPQETEVFPLWQAVLTAAVRKTFPGRRNVRIAVLADPDYLESYATALAFLGALRAGPGFSEYRAVRIPDLAALSPDDTPVLVGLFGETFPLPAFEAMVRFVRDGGLLAHFGGVPLYYAFDSGKLGGWRSAAPPGDERFRRRLHVGWEAWWTHKGLPKTAPRIRPAPGTGGLGFIERALETKRWFTDKALASGDRMVPILEACDEKGGTVGYPSVLYRLHSELRGAVLVNTLPGPGGYASGGVSRATQARYAVRALLTWAAMGVDKVFWYDFRDDGTDRENREHNFGLVDHALRPKPAYRAVQVLTRLLGPHPAFSGPPERIAGTDVFRVDTVNTSGARVQVLWSDNPEAVLSPIPPGTTVLDCYGRSVAVSDAENRRAIPVGRYGVLFMRLRAPAGAVAK